MGECAYRIPNTQSFASKLYQNIVKVQSQDIVSMKSRTHPLQWRFLVLGTGNRWMPPIKCPVLRKRVLVLKTHGTHKDTHYNDVILTTMASQITSLTVVYSTVYSDADQRKYQSSASLAFVWEIYRHRWIPRTKGQLRVKCFHLMTSSWPGSFTCFMCWIVYEVFLKICLNVKSNLNVKGNRNCTNVPMTMK